MCVFASNLFTSYQTIQCCQNCIKRKQEGSSIFLYNHCTRTKSQLYFGGPNMLMKLCAHLVDTQVQEFFTKH